MNQFKVILYPFSLLYGLITGIRNFFFDVGILRSKKLPPWVISIGNLSTGGTGKSPHIEYIAHLMNDLAKENENLKITYPNIAALSRGYGRKTKGFLLAHGMSNTQEVGDEPMQLRRRMTDIMVAVDEDRVRGIKLLMGLNPQIKLVMLDDAFQHRYVKPTISILLTNYYNPFYSDHILPVGTLREAKRGYKRAHIIIVTSVPHDISELEKKEIVEKINPTPSQKVFFSNVSYGLPKSVYKSDFTISLPDRDLSVILLTGIANPLPLKNYLADKVKELKHITFNDHHNYTSMDIARVVGEYHKISNPNKVILTTEKDYVRLEPAELKLEFGGAHVFYIPINVSVKEERELEDEIIKILSTTNLYKPSQKKEVKLQKLA